MYIFYHLIFISDMIYLKDILNEASLTPYQIFAPGTGGPGSGNMKFQTMLLIGIHHQLVILNMISMICQKKNMNR